MRTESQTQEVKTQSTPSTDGAQGSTDIKNSTDKPKLTPQEKARRAIDRMRNKETRKRTEICSTVKKTAECLSGQKLEQLSVAIGEILDRLVPKAVSDQCD